MVRGLIVDQGLRVTDSRLVDLPRPSDERLLMDLAIDPDGQRLYMVFEDLIAWRSLDSDDLSSSASRWHLERPVMPPGARIRRLGWAAERVWLATDHGLLEAPVLGAPFARAASPLGTSDCADLQSRGSLGAVALCRPGLFVLAPRSVPLDASSTEATPVGLEQPAARRRASPPRRRESIPPDPPVGEIRRRALERAGLTVKRFEGLWKGLANRAYWPEVSLRFGMDSDRDRSRDADQSFVSGETRHLLDQSRDEGRSFDAAVEFDWDLGGISYPNESVDLSREHRQVISLRDDVIDEIHQIYFERQSIRERLAEEPSLEPEEIARLTTRARELEAGLDAWTGGWLSRWRIAHAAAAVREVAPSASGRSPRLDAWQGPDHPDP
jgi:hypothetical protein